ncbi:DUF3040 domain-containing protein [Spiractinospora alimapuensis]|uniref:DUF3040 domain-containing protein n=1 Tax=Spiractinospora alimapuensis TaxID=2820884 RepID=UPI001F166225|nr:DUF3040 domain-containing protein [Spiractinospora alimapuensis]QVQ52946.1 DUF3040 domain-containing protein [Spiractinospora alimapuensis]
MSTWDNERRILGEIEEQLSRDDPRLAARMTSFESGEKPRVGPTAWKPWLLVGVVVTVILGLIGFLVGISMSSAAGTTSGAPIEALPAVASGAAE